MKQLPDPDIRRIALKLALFFGCLFLLKIVIWFNTPVTYTFYFPEDGYLELEDLPTPTPTIIYGPHIPITIESESEQLPETGIGDVGRSSDEGVSYASWYDQNLLHPSYRAIRGDGFGAASDSVEHGTRYLVRTRDGSRSVVVTVNDYCVGCAENHFSQPRKFDLQMEAFAELAPLSQGVVEVVFEKL